MSEPGGDSYPRKIFSPLRMCPLGAHVDHQLGNVTGMALEEGIQLHYRPRTDNHITAKTNQYPGRESFSIDAIPGLEAGSWGNYLRGAVQSLKRRYRLRRGFDAFIESRLPTGGLSSSAAVITAYLSALADVNEIVLDRRELVELAHWVEREWIGLNNGILDYASNVYSQAGRLLHLDCSSGEYELVPAPRVSMSFRVLLAYSGLSTALISTGYNDRVRECREAASILLERAGLIMDGGRANGTQASVTSRARARATSGATRSGATSRAEGVAPSDLRPVNLRDVPPEVFEAYGHTLPTNLKRRATHFFTEQKRVKEGVKAWQEGDLESFGALMTASGQSSLENYEAGCPELISLYEILKESRGVYGTRFSGGGHRGFCVAIVDPDEAKTIEARVREIYPARHPQHANTYDVFLCDVADGVGSTLERDQVV